MAVRAVLTTMLVAVLAACGGDPEPSGTPAVDAATNTTPVTAATAPSAATTAPTPATSIAGTTTTARLVEPVGMGEWIDVGEVGYRALEAWIHDPAAPRPGFEDLVRAGAPPVLVVVDLEQRNGSDRAVRTVDMRSPRVIGGSRLESRTPPMAANHVAQPDAVLPGGVVRDRIVWGLDVAPNGPVVLDVRDAPIIRLDLGAPARPPTAIAEIELAPVVAGVAVGDVHTFGAAETREVDYVAGIQVAVTASTTSGAELEALVAANYRYPGAEGLAAISVRFTAPPGQGASPLRSLHFATVDRAGVIWGPDDSCFPINAPVLEPGASADFTLCVGVPVAGLTRFAAAPAGTSDWVLFDVA